MHTPLEIHIRNIKLFCDYCCIWFNPTHWCPVSYPFFWEITTVIVWVFFPTPYNLVFHCMKLFDSIRELATKGAERGWGGIRCNTENCCQQFSDLKFSGFVLLWHWFLYISCDFSLRGAMAKQITSIILNSSFSATTKKLTHCHSWMIYWQVSTCLLSLIHHTFAIRSPQTTGHL